VPHLAKMIPHRQQIVHKVTHSPALQDPPVLCINVNIYIQGIFHV
jgi:hypothetical protein